jgi:hypothetical protein
MRPPRALPTAHFERNDITIICETVHEPASLTIHIDFASDAGS